MEISGPNQVFEALREHPGRVEKVFIRADQRGEKISQIIDLCRRHQVPYVSFPASGRSAANPAGSGARPSVYLHQAETALVDADSILAGLIAAESGYLAVLDGIYDPRNLGALARSAAAFACGGMVMPKRHTAPISPVVHQTSAGYIDKMNIGRVVNLNRFLDQAHDAGIAVIGLAADGAIDIDQYRFPEKVCLVLGNEDRGIRQHTEKRCDAVIRIPMADGIESLNLSAAASIIFYEIYRQHRRILKK